MQSWLRKLLMFLLVSCGAFPSFAQDISGIWRGYFITEAGENYKLEFQVTVNHAGAVTGVSYSYLDVRFYGKASMSGSFAATEKELTIQELKTVEVRNMGGGSTCIMNYKLRFAQSGKEEFLEGTYIGKQENVKGARWGDCGGGKVFLRRVPTSDFYTEPFLKNKTKAPAPDTVAVVPKPHETKPAAKTPGIPVKKTPGIKPQEKKPVSKPVAKQPSKTVQDKSRTSRTSVISRTDSVRTPHIAVTTPQRPPAKPVTIPPQTRDRENNVIKTIDVGSAEVTIKIYDNGEVDDDTVSVYLDNKLIIANKRISEKPLTYTFRVSEDEPEHIVTMVAENLGRIPPNTSLMIVNVGDKRYEVFVSTNERKNAVIRFRYKPGAD